MKPAFLTYALFTLIPATVAAQDCAGFPDCVYRPSQKFAITKSTQRTTYQDVTGHDRTVEFTLRIPKNKTGPLAVVIWAHGGGEGLDSSVGALTDWSTVTASAGYLSVSPAFHARNPQDQQYLCDYLGVSDPVTCADFSATSFDRPFDIRAVIDALDKLNQSGPLAGQIDLARLAVGGHSAGSSGALSVAGAAREYNGKRFTAAFLSDPRPKAFIALSPSAPGLSFLFDSSFQDPSTSWDKIDRPVLIFTGTGDSHEQFPSGRRIPYNNMPAGDKYRLVFADTSFSHEAFGDGLHDCGGGVPKKECRMFQNAITSTVLAYLDAYLNGSRQARDYLQNGYMKHAAPGPSEWSMK